MYAEGGTPAVMSGILGEMQGFTKKLSNFFFLVFLGLKYYFKLVPLYLRVFKSYVGYVHTSNRYCKLVKYRFRRPTHITYEPMYYIRIIIPSTSIT